MKSIVSSAILLLNFQGLIAHHHHHDSNPPCNHESMEEALERENQEHS